jgi:hypothetical protein
MPWPPRKGELLPRCDEPVGIEQRLRDYSLVTDHKAGGPKANGFWRMLKIDIDSIDHLEREIRAGISCTPVSLVRMKEPDLAACVVQFLIAGPGRYSHRTASLRTVWDLDGPTAPPRLITAFLRGKEHR